MYGFTQLKDGKLAFMGLKASISDSGLWVFVTDSTGKDLLWEKQYNLPGTDLGGNKLNNILPYSICATPDGGFTVVGTTILQVIITMHAYYISFSNL